MIDTFAGGKIPSGIPAQNAFLPSVSGITRDPMGNIVFCDRQLNVIRRINADGKIATIAGQGIPGFGGDGGPAVEALLYGPAFLQYDASGNLYFADIDNYRIRRIDPHGVITTIAGTGIAANPMTGPLGDGPATQNQVGFVTGLAVDSKGNVYLAESADPSIRRITPDGKLEIFATCSPCASNLFLPLAGDATGNLYVTEGSHLYKITPDGMIHNFAGFGSASNNGNGGPAIDAPPSYFIALAVDSAGNVYTEEEHFGTSTTSAHFVIRKIGTDGIVNVLAGTFTGGSQSDGPASGESFIPGYGSGLTAAADGTVTFADVYLVRQVTTKAMVQTIAGGSPQPAPDGTAALDAWFIQPTSIAFDRAGNLYIAESCVIQKIDSKGILSTIAGTGVCSGSFAELSGPALKAQLEAVTNVVIDSHGQIYFANLFGSLYVISTAGIIAKAATLPLEPLLAIDSQDRIYFLGVPNVLGRISPPVSINRSPPGTGIAIDKGDNVYVCCDNQALIDEYTPDLKLKQTWPTAPHFSNPTTLAIDASGDIWQGGPSLGLGKGNLPFGAGGRSGYNYSGPYGDGGPAESALIAPSAMAFAPNGDLYFLDASAGRVRRIHGSPPATSPVIAAGGIVNAASLAGGAVAPGELISIFGSNFGPPGLDVAGPQNNVIPDALNNVHVLFNGQLGRITARTTNQINVFVPYGVAGGTSTQVMVDVDSVTSQPVTVPIAPSAFGLSTANGSGTGQGAILNQDGSYNSASNPAARGSIVTLFGAGEGVTTPALPDGALEISRPYSTTAMPVTVKFANQTAQVEYAGAAPFLPTGVYQIDATIPMDVTPGNVPIEVSIGANKTTRDVTVSVK